VNYLLDAEVNCLLSRKAKNIAFAPDYQHNSQDIQENQAEKQWIGGKALISIKLKGK
jgi:hypothetical protein